MFVCVCRRVRQGDGERVRQRRTRSTLVGNKTRKVNTILNCFIYRNPIEPIGWREDFQNMIDKIPHKYSEQ